MSDERNPNSENLARLIRWAMILFFAYVFFVNLPGMLSSAGMIKSKPPEHAPVSAAKDKSEAKDCSGNMFTNFSFFAFPLFPRTSYSVTVNDIKEGTGEPAACGQRATLRYAYVSRAGEVIFNNMDTGDVTKDIRIGGGEMLKGFERGLVGMKVGGERDMTIPSQLAFGALKSTETLRDHDKFKLAGDMSLLTGRASLIALSPELPTSSMKLRSIPQRMGDGAPIECGDEAYIKLTLWKTDGTLLFSNDESSPIRFVVGSSRLPYGIEQGVTGMMQGGSAMLIIPPAFLHPLDVTVPDQALKSVTLPENETLLAAIELLPAPAPSSTPLSPKK